MSLSPADFFEQHPACCAGRAFARRYATMAEAWDACPRADWMLWALGRQILSKEIKLAIRQFAIWCARHTPLGNGETVWSLLRDDRSRRAVEVAERFLRGETTVEELKTARAACPADAVAWAVCTAAWGDGAVAADAALAAWDAAAFARASTVARAAGAAAGAAAKARSDGDSAAAKARVAAARKAQADQLRVLVPNPWREEVQP